MEGGRETETKSMGKDWDPIALPVSYLIKLFPVRIQVSAYGKERMQNPCILFLEGTPKQSRFRR